MKKQSVDVLDEARAFELKLNWQLFKAEQERLLYGPSKSTWTPGEPMYTRPRGEQYGEQCARPMFQLINISRFHSTPFAIYMIDERCMDCEVGWIGNDSCWMCGKDVYSLLYGDVLPPPLQFEGDTDLTLRSQVVTPNAMRAMLGLSPISEPLVVGMDANVAGEVSVGFREISRSNDMITYAIQDVVMVGIDLNSDLFTARLDEMERTIMSTMQRAIYDAADRDLRGLSAHVVTFDEAQDWCSAHPEIGVPVTWTARPIRTEVEIQLPEGGIPPEMLDPNYIAPPRIRPLEPETLTNLQRLRANQYYGSRVWTEERRPRGEV